MDDKSSALSAGLIMARLLDRLPGNIPVYPVYCVIPDKVPDGPAVSFVRRGLRSDAVKGAVSPRRAVIEVWCYHPTYGGSVELAEEVRRAVEGRSGRLDGLTLHWSALDDAAETYQGDKFVQQLTFTLTVN